MKAILFSISALIIGCVNVSGAQEDGQMFEEQAHRTRYAIPNDTVIGDLRAFPDFQFVLNFYTALKGLYVSGGFAKGNQLNSAILGQSNIPSVIWKSVRNAVKRTQWEIKNGDVSMRRLEATMALFSADTLLREPWLSSLAVEIAKRSTEAKNLAFAIRDIGEHLERQHVTRVDYTNGTFLRELISSWLTDQKLEFDEDLVSLLITIHHSIGPDHFDSLADVLEVIPYQVDGMFVMDAESLIYHSDHVEKEVRDADVGLKLTVALRNAFRNLTGTNESTTTHDFLYQLSIADIDKETTASALNAMSIVSRGFARTPDSRLIRSTDQLITLILRKQRSVGLKNFTILSREGIESGGIESMENVRQAMIAGARLIANLGSVDMAVEVAEKVPLAVAGDVDWRGRVDGVLDVLKYLPKVLNATETGGEIFLKAFLDEPQIFDERPFFLALRNADESLIRPLFENLNRVDQKIVGQVATRIQSWTVDYLAEKLANVTGARVLEVMRGTFGADALADRADALRLRAFLESLLAVVESVNGKDLVLRGTCKSLIIISTAISDYSRFIGTVINVIPLSRDGHWQDVVNAFWVISSEVLTSSDDFDAVLGPFEFILSSPKKKKTLVNLREVFLALKQLAFGSEDVVKAKVEFLKSFFGQMAFDDVTAILEGFDVNADVIASRVTATMYVDDFIRVLDASGSRQGLGDLLEFHKKYTTNESDPNASIAMINDMILFLHDAILLSKISAARQFERQNIRNHSNLLIKSARTQ